jgi:hypothetical protein
MKRERVTKGVGRAAAAAVVGAGAALLAASRGWWDAGADPVPGTFAAGVASGADQVTGGDRYPWLTALALVALAGGGALLATRSHVRTAIGALLMVGSAGIVLAVALAVARDAAPFWPIVAALGGLAVFDAGRLTVYKGRSWASMGARYERTTKEPNLWDELDHGRDPTA